MNRAHRLLIVFASIYHVNAFTPSHTINREPAPWVVCAQRTVSEALSTSDSLLPATSVHKADSSVDRKAKPPSASSGKGIVVARDSTRSSAPSKSAALAPYRGTASSGKDALASRSGMRRTVDDFVPASTLAVMVKWAEKLDPVTAPGESLLRLDKEQRLLLLAQVVLRLEQTRVDLSKGKPPGSVSMADLASSLGLPVHHVEMYYKLGLRARSYILMSMHDVVLGMAARYAAQYRMDQQELVQEGYKGVLQAVEKYDAYKASLYAGSTFQSYASFFIMRAMISAARDELGLGPSTPRPTDEGDGAIRPILLPSSAMRPVAALPPGRTGKNDVWEASVLMDDEDEDQEEDDEEEEKERKRLAAQRKGVERMRRQRAMRRRVSRGVASDDALAGYAGKEDLFGVDPAAARSPSEIIEDDQRAKTLAEFLTRASKEMSPQDMQVLSMVFGLNGHKPMKRGQVAEKLGLKAAAVTKSKERALRKLREMLNLDQ